jgi:CheY-like chemotaxis protein
MPGGSGTDLADQAVQLRPDLAVLYMSGLYDAADDQRRSQRRTVAKPFTPASLTEAVDTAMSAHAGH